MTEQETPWKPEDALTEEIKALLVPADPNENKNYALAFIQIVRLLKTQRRTGWLDHKIEPLHVESIADHMYRMSVISLLIPNRQINIDKCVKISVVHDIAESLVGDITPFDGITKEEKHRRELATIKFLSALIKPYNRDFATELIELWLDYEEIRCIEARYVKDIDKFEMIEQAWEYEQQFGFKHGLDVFYKARSSIKTPEISDLCDAILTKRSEYERLNETKPIAK